MTRQQGPRHAAGPRRVSWWAGPWPPSILIAVGLGLLAWELSWAIPLLIGG